MCRISKMLVPILLLIAAASYGQSLADVARQNQANKDKTATSAKKVYTTDDLSPSPAAEPAAEKTPEMWSRQILWQKRWVAYLQAQADKLTAVPHSSDDPQIAKAQEQLAKEKEKLAAMQEAAFEAGMPSTVYNPKAPVRFSRANGARRSLQTLNAQH